MKKTQSQLYDFLGSSCAIVLALVCVFWIGNSVGLAVKIALYLLLFFIVIFSAPGIALFVKSQFATKLSFPKTTSQLSEILEEDSSPLKLEPSGGFLSFLSLPIYEQTLSAGKSGKLEVGLTEVSFAGAKNLILNNKEYKVYSLKSISNEISISSDGNNWGWVQVKGHSMNNLDSITNKMAISNDDFVLVQFNAEGDENDIVLASWEDMQSGQSYPSVKRYRKDAQRLQSETTETGPDYEDISLIENNTRILGVVYAVAKPFLVEPPVERIEQESYVFDQSVLLSSIIEGLEDASNKRKDSDAIIQLYLDELKKMLEQSSYQKSDAIKAVEEARKEFFSKTPKY